LKADLKAVEARIAGLKAMAVYKGMKLTHQRLEIFREIASSLDHPDADAIYRSLRARMPTISLDTVYRTLWTLADVGLVKTLGPRRGSQRFDANLERHHHFICVHCGLTRDFLSEELDALALPKAAKAFGKVIEAQVEVHGVCAECEKRKTSPN
jgi:Fur family transcriptional regulator, peroxide stress response regulator